MDINRKDDILVLFTGDEIMYLKYTKDTPLKDS